MIEYFEFRINNKYASLVLPKEQISKDSIVTKIRITKEDPKFNKVEELTRKIKDSTGDFFFYYSGIERLYSIAELRDATLFTVKIRKTFEPAGEECGTIYDESTACDICGANRTQISVLKLRASSIPKTDIARTIAGEIIVSARLTNLVKKLRLKGFKFGSVEAGSKSLEFFQLLPEARLKVSTQTVAGSNIFDLSESSLGEIYKCPKGHTVGLNLISEIHVIKNRQQEAYDLFETEQQFGVKRGLLRPEHELICSPKFRKMVLDEKLSGFSFEIARIENE